MNTVKVPPVIEAYIKAANNCDAPAFLACFAQDALVNDVERDFRGIEAIRSWSTREVLVPKDQLVLEIVEAVDHYGDIIAKTKVDGNFDKTHLPDPLFITQHFTVRNGKIVKMIAIQVKEPNVSLEDALAANAKVKAPVKT
jgi:hypothetical protein